MIPAAPGEATVLVKPAVSVIIPTFNRAHFLSRAIRSVLQQSFQDFEIIVIDDASRENPVEVISQFADDRIRYFRHETNRGEPGARNTGISHARGELIAFLDDDDEWMPEKLGLQVQALNQLPPDIGGIYSGFFWINSEDGQILGEKKPPLKGDVYDRLLIRNFIGTPSTVIVRRDSLIKAGLFDEQITYGVDHDLWLRIAKLYRFEYIDRPLVRCYEHPERLSNNMEVLLKGQEDMLRKYPMAGWRRRAYHSTRYLCIGERLYLQGDTVRGKKLFLDAIKAYPLNWRSYLNLIVSTGGPSVYLKWRVFRKRIGNIVRGKKH